jgi:predicted RND superfamily exporter protein
MLRKAVDRLVDTSGRRPITVLLLSILLMAATWGYASRLQLRSDLLELLPRDSPGFRAYEHQLGRVGGGASLIVVVESPNREANERFIDDLGVRIRSEAPGPIAYVESDTKELRAFFSANRWLYADLSDLEKADRELDAKVAERAGLVENLDEEQDQSGSAPVDRQGQSSSALRDFEKRWDDVTARFDDSRGGHFETPDGTSAALRIVTTTSGTGDAAGDSLLARIQRDVEDIGPLRYDSRMVVGYAGDIPNAIEEKKSLMSDALLATVTAFVLICAGVVVFYRAFWPLLVIALPALFGVGCAYAFATATFGYVNTTGAFLGAIILGNGINYPIVLVSRYRQFRARGQAPESARRDAVWNAFRAELVGASVGSIAYGSLTITHFRGFSQFGTIGFVGMLLVWASVIPLVPAMLTLVERFESRRARRGSPGTTLEGTAFTRFIARATAKRPAWFVAGAVVVSVAAIAQLPRFLRDPWEYDFDKLGSVGSKASGAGHWSNKADQAFGGKTNVAGALMLADRPEQVPLVARQIRSNDDRDPEGKLIANIVTISDFLPGTPDEQAKKLEVLDRIRARITPRVLAELSGADRAAATRMKPPEGLRVLGAADLPALLRVRFQENNGVLGTIFYVKYKNDVSLSDGRNLLRIARSTDNVVLPDGALVRTASRATVFAEMIRSMERDGPLATLASFCAVLCVVLVATHSLAGAISVVSALLMGVAWTMGVASALDHKLNFLNFIALPITFGIGSEYPFNIYDRSRLVGSDPARGVTLSGGAVALCSYTTTIGYGSLLFSDNQALRSFGWLAMSGEIACLLAALFVVPALLHVFGRFSRRFGQKLGGRLDANNAAFATRSSFNFSAALQHRSSNIACEHTDDNSRDGGPITT